MASKRAFLATSFLTASWLMGSAIAVAQAPIDAIAPEAAAPTPPAAAEPVVAEPVMEVPAAVVEVAPESLPTVESAPVAEAAPAPLQVQSAEAFIDRSDYSLGATERETVPVEIISRNSPAANSAIADVNIPAQLPIADQAAEAAPSVQIGSLNLSTSGLSWQPEPPTSVSVVSPGKSYLDLSLIKPLAMASQNLINMVFPVAVPAPITSLFGWRIHPISGAQKLHTGTDIGAAMGTPVMATMPGRVILADDMGGYGLTVAIEHDNGVRQTLYAHMSQLFVRPGDVVQQGTVIGRVGSTGASTGPHLHFELRQMMPDGTWVALDAGKTLESAVSSLTRSLQLAQQPKTTAMQPTKIDRQ
jgi:murein DD-endopeptidase MepM/ murein hydrolase activator NlpD